MEKEVTKGIVKTFADAINDAQMQYDFAIEARESKETGIAQRHVKNATTRLDEAREWLGIIKSVEKNEMSDITEALLYHYTEWHEKLTNCVNRFHSE